MKTHRLSIIVSVSTTFIDDRLNSSKLKIINKHKAISILDEKLRKWKMLTTIIEKINGNFPMKSEKCFCDVFLITEMPRKL